jgi:oligoendopeptidase F
VPEVQQIPDADLAAWLADAAFDEYRVFMAKLLRLKAHVLGEAEERILALQQETAQTAEKTFSLLTNVDLEFGTVTVGGEERGLTQSSFSQFMEDPDRRVRAEAYGKFYRAFDAHKQTLGALYEGNVQQDAFEARARGYGSAREMALFPDKVPLGVYDNLVGTVREHLGALHRYYAIRKKVLGVEELRHYDVYVPLVGGMKRDTPYEEGVAVLREALAPLGSAYVDTLCGGLLGGWVDRYENKGKRSGAFSSGTWRSDPYILLNYKSDVLRDLFTMAHEGGHSMHSLYSARANPVLHDGYTIFEAEVASTCNEALLFEHLLAHADSPAMRRYLLCMRVQDLVATLYRQTMFAEFERDCHGLLEAGQPLTVEALRETYHGLLTAYFGPTMVFEEQSDLEGLRIPHFYNAFYVYKYATGISAALALADRVLKGGKAEKDAYLGFLHSGGSRYPLESLKAAGVDMGEPAPVEAALRRFGELVEELGEGAS